MKKLQPPLREYRDGGELYRLFEHIPKVLFFAKDAEGRLLMGNQRFVEHCGFSSLQEIVGKSDYDIFPKYMADKFATDDQAVLRSGKPLLHLVELFPSRDRLPEWYSTNKYPIFDNNGAASAVCGIVQNLEHSFEDNQDPVSKVVGLIKDRFNQTLSIPDLSREAGISNRQMERLFKKRFSITPREYIIRLRVLIAADQLRFTIKGITEIALDCGFYDHSSFTRQFKRHMGVRPLQFRKSESG